jgi:hypothetical protein
VSKAITLLTLASALLMGNSLALGKSASTTITIIATVDKFAEWADSGPVVVQSDWPAINQVGQSRTVSKSLTLYTNTEAAITAEAGANGGILKRGTQSLTTEYKLTGKLTNPDSHFKVAGSSSGEFFNSGNVYNVAHESGVGAYPLNLDVQITSPAKEAVEPGEYTCSVILTVGW